MLDGLFFWTVSWKSSPNMRVEKCSLIRVLLRQRDQLVRTITLYKPECQMIHQVKGIFFLLMLFRFICVCDCERRRSWCKQPALPPADRLLAAE